VYETVKTDVPMTPLLFFVLIVTTHVPLEAVR
jgi:hypothetical protein